MTSIPSVIKAFKKEAASILNEKSFKNLFFSFGSYQAEINEPGTLEPIYSFIQISKRRELKDFFCTCKDSEPGLGCKHVSALYLIIMDSKGVPLHERYNKSIYKALVRLFFDKKAEVKPKKKEVLIEYPDGSVIAKMTLKSERGVYLFEDTFLAENQEELQGLWGLSFEEGESMEESELIFEQSSWNEWGKKLIFLKAFQHPSETLKGNKEGLPNMLKLNFKEVKLDVPILQQDLPELIPYLESIGGYPTLEEDQNPISRIIYHEKSSILELTFKTIKRPDESGAIYLPGWVFFKDQGFIKEDRLFPASKIVLKAKIPHFFKKHGPAVASLIKTAFVQEKTPLQYALSFDNDWNLIIDAYLFRKGDLQKEGSWLHEDYAYIAAKGFYRVDEPMFTKNPKVVPPRDVASFIHEKRSWLNQIPGFEIHFVAVESEMEYALQNEETLVFTRKGSLQDGPKTKEFGTWVYVESMGFFPRETASQPFFIKPNTIVTKEHVPLFIKERREELKLIKGFFLAECPIDDAILELKAEKADQLSVKPVYKINSSYKEKKISFFEDIVFVENEGFFELPPHLRLPEGFRTERKLKHDELQHFIDEELEKLRRFIPILDARLKKPSSLKIFISKAEKNEALGPGWYGIKVFLGSEYDKIDFLTIWEGKITNKRYLFTDAGLIDLKDERFRWLGSLKKQNIDRDKGMLILSALDFYRLDALENMECSLIPKEDKASEEIINQLRQFKVVEKLDLSLLQAELRSYQQTGVEWLWFLYVHGLSGLLCDDMGLGKTHQAMGLISAALTTEKTPGKILVVCPASVIHHWEDKIKDFMPSLKASIYHGLERSYEAVTLSSDIIITTYGIIRRDIHLFVKTLFTIAVFDEIQVAKNKESRVHFELKKIRALMKLGLSGTPIENTLIELKSLFDIVLPHYMPSDTEFRDRFMKPIQKERDEQAKIALRRLIRPFVLRRKKNEVLSELPEKTEEISHCDLSKEQVNLYNDMLTKSREPLLRKLSEESGDIPYFHVFALLTQLKKICDHPALFLGKTQDFTNHESGKWNLFLELISEAFESGQKVVVFTQYLGMLDIMSAHFAENRIGFALIKGSTKNRGEEIRRFNQDESCRVFLGSLLAGGLGIDLIGGSIVIHYDRWWNAARENQATDRVYRLGQKRGVQVFKLVTKNTFEERIDEIIREKGKLAEDIVTSEEAALKLFDRHELKSLLEYSRWEPMDAGSE